MLEVCTPKFETIEVQPMVLTTYAKKPRTQYHIQCMVRSSPIQNQKKYV